MRIRNNQSGILDPLMIPLIVSIILVVSLASFGIWSYLQFLDQRNNTEATVAAAVSAAEVSQQEVLEAEFAEREKSPFSTWTSSGSIGSIKLTYPKGWSAYIDEKEGTANPLAGLFHPKFISADNNTRFALGIVVDESDYGQTVSSFDASLEDGSVSAKPITVAGVTGIRFDGQIDTDYSGAIVIFPLRDKTVKIRTESNAYLSDFTSIVLKNLTFEK